MRVLNSLLISSENKYDNVKHVSWIGTRILPIFSSIIQRLLIHTVCQDALGLDSPKLWFVDCALDSLLSLKLGYTGYSIPSIAFGTWKVGNGQICIDKVKQALDNGFNHIGEVYPSSLSRRMVVLIA